LRQVLDEHIAILLISVLYSSQPSTADRYKFSFTRNRVSLGIRCRWGMRNALFYVAKDPNGEDKDKVLGVAMWMPPRPAGLKETWSEWLEGWKVWAQQVGMNLWYGRGGLNVKVRLFTLPYETSCFNLRKVVVTSDLHTRICIARSCKSFVWTAMLDSMIFQFEPVDEVICSCCRKSSENMRKMLMVNSVTISVRIL